MVIFMSSDFWTASNSGNDNEMVHGKALRLHKSAALADLSTVVVLVDQIVGVEDASPESVKAMSAVGRSGQNEHHAPCLANVPKWPCAPKARTTSEGGSHTDNCR